jgi:F0F1-type ATP synthase delta subunit
MTVSKKQLSAEQIQELIKTLKARFEQNMHRHKEIE